MPTNTLDRLRSERDEARDLAIAMAEGDDFDPRNKDFTELQNRAEALDGRVDTLTKAMEARESAKRLDARIVGSVETRQAATTEVSFGEMFTRSEQFQHYPGRGIMSAVELPLLETRAPLTIATFPGSIQPVIRTRPDRPLRTPVTDAITVIPVSQNGIEVVQILMTGAPTGAAAKVAEGSAKPETVFTETVTPISLDTVAHWSQLTRQLIEDAPAVRATVERKLVSGITAKLESEAATVISAGTYPAAVNTDLLTAVRIGIGSLQDSGYNPDALFLNPADWASLDVSVQGKRTDGATGVLQQTYWGLTVVPLSALAAGKAIVADGSQAFEVYRRSGVNTYITDSHASSFISNVFTILAEARQKTVISDANAVRKTSAT